MLSVCVRGVSAWLQAASPLGVARAGWSSFGMARLPLPEHGTCQYPYVVEQGGFV